MNKYLSLFLLLVSVCSCESNWPIEYDSKERDAYYSISDDSVFNDIIPPIMSNEMVLGYQNPFFELKEITDFTPYNDSLFFTPYLDSINRLYFMWDERPKDCIGKIDKKWILKHEKKGDLEAFVYWDLTIGVAYSIDGGASWDYYNTGIKQRTPLCVKWYSNKPLINSEGDLEIEACLLRESSYRSHHFGVANDLVKDGLLLTMKLDTLRKDTDHDGLTDIEESLLRTNPNSSDTDGDGIPDNLDMNPRMNVPRTEKTIIYEALINGDNRVRFVGEGYGIIPFDEIPKTCYYSDSVPTIMIVTDEPDIQSVCPTRERIIFLTSEEYEKTKNPFDDEFMMDDFSPLFRVDGEKDKFILSSSGDSWWNEYVVERERKGWKIQAYSSIIE